MNVRRSSAFSCLTESDDCSWYNLLFSPVIILCIEALLQWMLTRWMCAGLLWTYTCLDIESDVGLDDWCSSVESIRLHSYTASLRLTLWWCNKDWVHCYIWHVGQECTWHLISSHSPMQPNCCEIVNSGPSLGLHPLGRPWIQDVINS